MSRPAKQFRNPLWKSTYKRLPTRPDCCNIVDDTGEMNGEMRWMMEESETKGTTLPFLKSGAIP
jgi:hypothetical protein